MASSKGLVCSVVIFSVLAILLQLSGLLTPGWFVYKTEDVELNTLPVLYQQMMWIPDQPQALPQESNDLPVPDEQDLDTSSSEEKNDVEPRPWGRPHPHHHHHHHHHHHNTTPRSDDINPQDPGLVQSPVVGVETDIEVDEVVKEKTEVSVHIGLWFARGCVHVDRETETSGEKKKGRCNCTTVSIEDAMMVVNNDPQIAQKHEAYFWYNEMRIEAVLASVFAIVGFMVAVVAIRKDNRPTSFVASALMLTSCMLMFIPVIRLGMANRELRMAINALNELNDEMTTKVTGKLGCPYSLFLSAGGMLAALISCLILSISSCRKGRRHTQGNWTRFYNEYPGEPGSKMDLNKEKCQELVFRVADEAEPLPEKVPIE